MIIKAYLKVTPQKLEEIKEKYNVLDIHIISNSKRKTKRCDECNFYYPCNDYEGFCMNEELLVDANGTCEDWYF